MATHISMPFTATWIKGFRTQHRSQTSTWPYVVTWTTDINPEPGCIRTSDPHVAFRGSMDQGHQHGPRQLHRPFTSAWPPVAAQPTDINVTSCSSADHGHQHGPWASTGFRVATQATHTNILISPGSKAQGHHQGFSQLHKLHMSIWISGVRNRSSVLSFRNTVNVFCRKKVGLSQLFQ